jgi:hypothetical protein
MTTSEVEVEVTLRPTVNRLVRLSVLPLLEQVTRCYVYLSDITVFIFHVGRPLWRDDGFVICSEMTQVQFQVTLRPTVCRPVRLGAGLPMGPMTRFEFLCLAVTSSSRCRAPSPISPMNRVIQPKAKVKSQGHVSAEPGSCEWKNVMPTRVYRRHSMMPTPCSFLGLQFRGIWHDYLVPYGKRRNSWRHQNLYQYFRHQLT